MKKIFTLIAGMALALGASAQTTWAAPEEAPEAGATIVDDNLLTAKTVYATKISVCDEAGVLQYNGNSYTLRMDVRVDKAPTADMPAGTDKGNATPVVITPKKNVTISFVYRRQAVDGEFVGGDGKDLKVCDQAATSTMLPGELTVINDIDGSYGNVSQKFELKADHTYTVFGRGTTIGLFLFTYEENTNAGGEDPQTPVDPTPGEDEANLISTTVPSNAIAYWYNSTNAAEYTAPCGTFVAEDGESVNYANGDYMTIRVNGKASDLTEKYITVTPTEALSEGDIIAVKAYRNKDSDAGASLYIGFANGSGAVIGDEGDGTAFNNVYKGLQPNTISYTVTAAEAGSKSMVLSRQKASTNIFIVAFQITKGQPITGIESVAIDAVDAPAYNVLGQPVDNNYRGLVIKNGKKFYQK